MIFVTYPKKILITSILVLFIASLCAFGHEDIHHNYLWKVQSHSATVYLLGSVHAADRKLYPLDANIEDAFINSENLVFEVNPANNMTDTLNFIEENGKYTNGSTLKNSISSELYYAILNKFSMTQFTGLTEESFNLIKPWVYIYLIDLVNSLNSNQYSTPEFSYNYGLDTYFYKKRGLKTVLELESTGSQLRLFSEMPKDELEVFLRLALEHKPIKERILMKKTLLDWENGDIKAMEKTMQALSFNVETLEDFYYRLLDERNIRMADKIESYLHTDSSYFVIAGAAHYYGPNGIIRLLENKGYEVTQVRKKEHEHVDDTKNLIGNWKVMTVKTAANRDSQVKWDIGQFALLTIGDYRDRLYITGLTATKNERGDFVYAPAKLNVMGNFIFGRIDGYSPLTHERVTIRIKGWIDSRKNMIFGSGCLTTFDGLHDKINGRRKGAFVLVRDEKSAGIDL